MLNFLIRTGELAGAPGTGTFLAGRRFLAHDVRMEITRAFLRKVIGLGVLWTLVDDVVRTLNDNGIADADVAAVSQRFAVAADALDVVFIVQGDILHDHSTHADGIEFADRRKRSGSADLKFDILEDGHRAFGGKFVG